MSRVSSSGADEENGHKSADGIVEAEQDPI